MTHESDLVLTEIEDGVATVLLNRPGRLNAWTPDLEQRLFAVLDELERDSSVRAVVLSGSGRGFCAGADLDVVDGARSGSQPSSRRLLKVLCHPKPIVVAVNGACAGVGLQLALLGDVRFVASDAKITTAFTRRGLVAEHGIAWLLPRIVGSATALELLLSARVFHGDEAVAIGMAHRALPADQVLAAAQEYAADLAQNVSPTSMAVVKRQVLLQGTDPDLLHALDEADALMDRSFSWPDKGEGASSFRERRAPAFPPVDTAALPALPV